MLTGLIALLLFLGMFGIQLRGYTVTVKKLAICATSIAVASILSEFRIDVSAYGGGITFFSMLVIALPAFFYGPITGIATATAYGVFQILLDPYLVSPLQICVDYLFAFGAIGIAGFWADKKFGLAIGYFAGCMGRYLFSFISGAFFFGAYAWEGWNPIPYSLAYNAMYLMPEAIVTAVLLCIPAIERAIKQVKVTALRG